MTSLRLSSIFSMSTPPLSERGQLLLIQFQNLRAHTCRLAKVSMALDRPFLTPYPSLRGLFTRDTLVASSFIPHEFGYKG